MNTLTALLAAGLLTLAAGTAQGETLRVGIFQSEPGMWRAPDGSYRGAYVDYFRLLAPRMGATEVVFESLPFKRLLAALDSGEVDAALLLVRSPDREKQFTFAGAPLLTTRTGLAVRKDGPVRNVETAADLADVRIGYTAGAVLSPFLQEAHLKIDRLFQLDAAEAQIRQLAAGRLDAVYSPDLETIRYYIRKYGDPAGMTVIPLPDSPVAWYTAFSRAAGPRWAAAYDRALADQSRLLTLDQFFAGWSPSR